MLHPVRRHLFHTRMKTSRLNTLRKVRAQRFTPVQYHSPTGVRFGCVIKEGRKWVTLQFGAGDTCKITMDDYQAHTTEIL